MATRTLTAPLAIIEYNGVAIGKIRTLRLTETWQRGEVRGVGETTAQEVPILSFSGTFTASTYMIDMSKLGSIKNPFLNRSTGTLKVLLDTILLDEQGVNIHIYRKTAQTVDSNTGLVTESGKERVGIMESSFMDSQNWDISENNLSGQDLSGRYLNPIIFPEE